MHDPCGDPLTAAQQTEAALVSDDPLAVARMFHEAKVRLEGWRSAVAEIEAHLCAVMEGHEVKRLELPGVGVVEASRKTRRTGWRHDELLGDLARAVQGNRRLSGDGELEPPEWVMARLVGECLSLSGGKVTGIRKVLGRDPDEYCEVRASEPAVRLALFDRAAS